MYCSKECIFVLFYQIFSTEVTAERFFQNYEHNQRDYNVRKHIGEIVKQGIKPGGAHGEPEKFIRHILSPDGCADHKMNQKSCAAAYDSAGKDIAFFPTRKTCKTESGEGQKIVTYDALPADGDTTVGEKLKQAENKTCKQPWPDAPAHGIEHERDHGKNNIASPGHLPQLYEAQYLCGGD